MFKESKKIRNIILMIIGSLMISAYFMVALTFQHIGNGSKEGNLIAGFTLGLLSSLGLVPVVYFGFFKKINLNIELMMDILMIVLSLLAILSFVFGTIGYLNVVK